MNRNSGVVLLSATILIAGGVRPARGAFDAQQPRRAAADAYGLINAVNALRSSRGLSPYIVNSALMGTAQGQASYMASTSTITHTGPDGSRPYQRALAAGYSIEGGYPPFFFSENILSGGDDLSPEAAVQIWTGDDPHMNTMTSTIYQEIGAGVAVSGGMIYYVVDCARPKSSGPPSDYTPGSESALSTENEIIMPVRKSTPNADGDVIHEVQSGQSLWQIAIEYGVKIDQIRALNQLPAEYVINPGDTLLIMKVGTATPLPATATLAPTATPTQPPSPTLQPSPSPTPTTIPLPLATNLSGAEIVVGAIIIVALAAAALVAWVGRARQIE
jgi:uncharacterized protein YkwD